MDKQRKEHDTWLLDEWKKRNDELQRLVDEKTADLEKKNRELEVENALERVRARAMAMHHPSELQDVINTVHQQFKSLGIAITGGVFIVINEESKTDINCWGAGGTAEYIERVHIPYLDQPIYTEFLDGILKGPGFFQDEYSYEEKIALFDHLFQHPPYREAPPERKKEIMSRPGGYARSCTVSKYTSIFIINHHGRKFSEEENNILVRFGNVFEQTYTRFLDLKKAEEQARETEIQLALERVRARTMAMQHSEELSEAAFLLAHQVRDLGINAWGCAFHIYSENDEGDLEWFSNEDGYLPFYKTPRNKFFKEYYDNRESEESIYIKEFNGKNCADHYEYLMSLPVVGDALKALRDSGISLPTSQIDHVVYFNRGYLLFITYDLVPESHDIFKRFAKEFEQTYTRFLDLKRAEAQALEAKIEAALEKVRSSSLAMQKAEELGEVAMVLFQKLKELDLPVSDGVALVTHFEGSKDQIEWMESPGYTSALKINLTYFDHPVLSDYWKAKQEGLDFIAPKYSAEENRSFLHHIFNYTDYRHTPQDIKDYCLAAKTYSYSAAFQKNSSIFINDYSGRSLSELEIDILKRFSKVFEQAYVRFLDLQKAEEQAREAQIEAALERVRTVAMSMNKSVDLLHICEVSFKELVKLEFRDLRNALIHILNDEEGNLQDYDYSDSLGGHITTIFYDSHPYVVEFLRQIKRAEDAFAELIIKDEQLKDWRDFRRQSGQNEDDRLVHAKALYYYGYSIGDGDFTISTFSPINEEQIKVLKRFRNVFDLAYRRYIDITNAESQAREAVKQASLDRIRGQIASMRNAEDLQQITPLIWRELMTLEVPFFRCGIFIINEKKKNVDVYLTTPEGNPLAALHLDFDSNVLTRNTVASWKKNEVYQEHWNREEFISWTKEMMKLRQIETPENYQGASSPPESLHLHFIPFAQGMLYVGHTEQLAEDKIDLVKALSEAFAIAYARYQDFVVMEEAKEQVEKALNDLKATQNQLVHAEKMASLGELTAGIAHEIQNPLNFVNNFSEVSAEIIAELDDLLERGNIDEVKDIARDLKQNLEKINLHGKRASSIVKGMLEHSRAGSGEKQPTDLNSLADEYLRLAYHGLRAKDKSFNADFKLEADHSLPKVKVIGQDIGRVLLNLINNAFYAVTEKAKQNIPGYKPEVVVTTRNLPPFRGDRGGSWAEITVKDNGNGIPEKIKDKIFQPFFTTKPAGQGTGLGLSMSYDIITKGHGGTIGIESGEGEGTTFTITLPINPETAKS